MSDEIVVEIVESTFTVDIQTPEAITIDFPVRGATGVGVPTGGTTGQVLSKETDADYATEWVDPSGGGNMEIGAEVIGANPNRFLGTDENGDLDDSSLGAFSLNIPIGPSTAITASGVTKAGWALDGTDPAYGLADLSAVGGDKVAIVPGINSAARYFSIEDGNGLTHFRVYGDGRIVVYNDIEITDDTKGIILTSPDDTRWRITVDNSGNLTTTEVV